MESNTFKIRDIPTATANLFFDPSGPVDVQRFEVVKYPILNKILENQLANYWRPTEFNLSRDKADFLAFDVAEEHVFTSNLRRQIVLDSVQGRAPSLCYGPVVSDPTAEAFIHAWTFYEGIHSNSYTHIIRNVYANPSVVFDGMKEIREIVECGDNISKYYDALQHNIYTKPWAHIDTKRSFYLSMVSTYALEAMRFHVSFACTFSFGNRKKVEGSSRTVSTIRQDESFHCAFVQNVLKILPKEDEDFARFAAEHSEEVEAIIRDVYNQELQWIHYLFMKGPIVGLTVQELILYLNDVTAKVCKHLGIKPWFEVPKHKPLPWIAKFENEEGDDQPPPQEEELNSYQVGNVNLNVDAADLIIDF